MSSAEHLHRSDCIEVAAQRKVAAGATTSLVLARERARYALRAYRGVQFGALVFDLDGTLAESNAARDDVRRALAWLADAGVRVAIATGRAPSERARALLHGLVEERHRERVLVGYRNGAQVGRLSEDAVETLSPLEPLDFARLRELLTAQVAALGPEVTLVADTPAQVTLRSTHSRYVKHPRQLVELAQEAIVATCAEAKAVLSPHAIDIVHRTTSKRRVAAIVADRSGAPVVCFGDAGMWPGNDFELLAHAHGLSVDQVSADLGGCWNFLPGGVRGVNGTLHYLAQLDIAGAGAVAFGERFFDPA